MTPIVAREIGSGQRSSKSLHLTQAALAATLELLAGQLGLVQGQNKNFRLTIQ
jgi:hypothetical protein